MNYFIVVFINLKINKEEFEEKIPLTINSFLKK